MIKIISTAASAVAMALALLTVPSAAFADDPVSDAMATQDPAAYSGFTFKPCKTRASVNCYVDVIGRTGQAGQSFWRIRVGRMVCVKFWDTEYDQSHGHCSPFRHRH